MKNTNWKVVKETAKTIALTALLAGTAGIAFGIHYEHASQEQIKAAVKAVSTQTAQATAPVATASK